jgi:putative DNA primase/helicase
MEIFMKLPKNQLAIEDEPEIRIVALALQIEDSKSFLEVQYRSLTGKMKTRLIPRELFRTPTKVADLLMGGDADIKYPVESVKAAQAAFLNFQKCRNYQITRRTGWHGSENFVYPTETFGPRREDLLYDDIERIDPALGMQTGSLSDWAKGLKEPCRLSDYVLFAASLGAGSVLLDLVNQDEGAVFHLHGTEGNERSISIKTKSSSGKTLATRVAVSVVGRCKKTDLATFAITPRAVEDFCYSHNHLIAALDEEGRALDRGGRRNTENLAYVIPGGRSTLRSNKATQDHNLENVSWALLAVSNGENPLDVQASRSRPEGAQTRMICVPVPPGRDGGIFNRVEGTTREISQQCKELARQVEKTISENYGVVMPTFLSRLVNERITVPDRIRKIIDSFVKQVGADIDPWERRFAEKFGIVLAGAILMSEHKIGPWTRKRARRAIKRLYREARKSVVRIEDATDRFLERLRKRVIGGKRFPIVKKGHQYREEISWGLVRKMSDGRWAVLIRLSRFEQLANPRAAASQILDELEKRDVLLKAADGKQTRQIMIAGSEMRHRYVCLDRNALLAD